MIRIGNTLGLFGNAVAVLGNPIPTPPLPDASGGIVTYDGDYRIHTFNSSSYFTLFKSIDASVLILGQGGKGGLGYSPVIKSGGGGGASGILRQFNMSLSPSTYPVSFGPYPGGTVSFNGQSATGGTNGTNGIYNNGGGGGSNADYSGYDGGVRNGGAGAGAGGNATGSLYKYGPGIHSSISGSDIEYGVGGEGGLGASGSNGQNGPSGIVIIRYKYK